jgi:ribose/xylose/arabinose/galactoside ABC-type transport system permease subunit
MHSMSEAKQQKSSPGEVAAMGGVGMAAAICCGALLIFGTVGVGAVLAIAFSAWILVPTGLALIGIVAWYGSRRYRGIRAVGSEDKAEREKVGR